MRRARTHFSNRAAALRWRLIRYFSTRVLVLNVLFSAIVFVGAVAAGVLMRGTPLAAAVRSAAKVGGFSGITAGFGFGLLYYFWMRRLELHMYRSHGVTPFVYIPAAYALNAAPFACILIVLAIFGA